MGRDYLSFEITTHARLFQSFGDPFWAQVKIHGVRLHTESLVVLSRLSLSFDVVFHIFEHIFTRSLVSRKHAEVSETFMGTV